MKMPVFHTRTQWLCVFVLPLGLTMGGIWPAFPLAYGQAGSLSGNGLGTIVTPSGTTIFVEIADSPDTRMQGLMSRPSMAPDRGMLFLFPGLADQSPVWWNCGWWRR